jgi:hypothetical protein
MPAIRQSHGGNPFTKVTEEGGGLAGFLADLWGKGAKGRATTRVQKSVQGLCDEVLVFNLGLMSLIEC